MYKKYLILSFILYFLGIGIFPVNLFSQTEESDYVLNPQDLIEIDVYGEPDLHTSYRITQEGMISFPLIGNIKAAGLTVSELERLITELLAQDYLVNPQVKVFVREYAKIFISGLVRMPGQYELKRPLTLLSAISLAGGFLPEANTSQVKLTRIKEGKSYTQEIDVEKIINNVIPDIPLQPNDTILVEQYGSVSIIGEVRRPGNYPFKKGLTLLELISIAGGFTDIANIDGTSIVRVEEGKKKIIRVKVSQIIKGADKTKDIPLKPTDTVVVPESLF
jgi:polysaccharide export outer membrane protein